MAEIPGAVLARESHKNINGTEYIVKTFFKTAGVDTVEQKLARLISDWITNELKAPETPVLSAKAT